MKNLLLLSILLISNLGFSQLKSIVIDDETKGPVPFVNIWVENENIGTTSDKNGVFTIDTLKGKFLVFSSLGYQNKKIEISKTPDSIFLMPKINKLEEVTIQTRKETNELILGKFANSDVGYFYGSFDKPEMQARFFAYDTIYSKTPYLKTLKFRIFSIIKNAKFNVRIYSKTEDGKPGNPLYDKNIIGIAKKGTKNIEIDLSDLHIIFPEDGIFISYEWLIIPDNEYRTSFRPKDSKEKIEQTMYEPKIGFVPSETNKNSWTYRNGNWVKVEAFEDKTKGHPEQYLNKYGLLAIEMTLTN